MLRLTNRFPSLDDDFEILDTEPLQALLSIADQVYPLVAEILDEPGKHLKYVADLGEYYQRIGLTKNSPREHKIAFLADILDEEIKETQQAVQFKRDTASKALAETARNRWATPSISKSAPISARIAARVTITLQQRFEAESDEKIDKNRATLVKCAKWAATLNTLRGQLNIVVNGWTEDTEAELAEHFGLNGRR